METLKVPDHYLVDPHQDKPLPEDLIHNYISIEVNLAGKKPKPKWELILMASQIEILQRMMKIWARLKISASK